MKKTTLLFACITLLALTSCKKNCLNDDGSDIAKSLKAGDLFNTWIIDDDNNSNHDATQNGNTFHDKKNPSFYIARDYSYILKYWSLSAGTQITETGTVSVDANAKTITFTPSNGAAYSFNVLKFNEEVFTWQANYTKTTYTTNSEGVQVPTTQHLSETLYMEDDD